MLRSSAILILLAAVPRLGAQHAGHQGTAAGLRLGAQAIPLVTHASPVIGGRSATEASLTQPLVTAGADLGGLRLQGMLNLEALTLPDGEPNAGIWGEGFVDRRHPHTLLHELVATASGRGISLTAGRGFVPFGSDDPMARPFVKYPLNHHLAQVLERLVVSAAAQHGPARVEAALYNGDEPTGTGSVGTLRRLGDSWAVRGTLEPGAGLELAASHARLTSPEQPSGGGLDQRKTHLSVRWERRPSEEDGSYALLEWARTDELHDGSRAFRFYTALAEVAMRRSAVEAALRLERTERPEEERLADPFRTPFPHADVNLLGITRWHVATLSLSRGTSLGPLGLRPFAEGSAQWVRPLHRPSLFDPRAFYGDDRLWSLTLGARMEIGAPHPHRPGRYGAAAGHPPRRPDA